MSISDEQIEQIRNSVHRQVGLFVACGVAADQIDTLLSALTERDSTIAELKNPPMGVTASPIGYVNVGIDGIHALSKAIEERDAIIAELRDRIGERIGYEIESSEHVEALKAEIAELRKPVVVEPDRQLDRIKHRVRYAGWSPVLAMPDQATPWSAIKADFEALFATVDALARDNARWLNARDAWVIETSRLQQRLRESQERERQLREAIESLRPQAKSLRMLADAVIARQSRDPFHQCASNTAGQAAQAIDSALTALAASPTQVESKASPVAWVPVHPRQGPLWANTIDSLDRDRPNHYPLMPLYSAPVESERERELRVLLVEGVSVYDEYCNEWPDAIAWRQKVGAALALPQQKRQESGNA